MAKLKKDAVAWAREAMKKQGVRITIEYKSLNDSYTACAFWKMKIYCAGEGKTIKGALRALQQLFEGLDRGTIVPRYKEIQELTVAE